MFNIYQASLSIVSVLFVVLFGASCRPVEILGGSLLDDQSDVVCSIVQVIQLDGLDDADSIEDFQIKQSVLESETMLRGVAQRLSSTEVAQILPSHGTDVQVVDVLRANRFIEPVFEDLQIRIYYKHADSDLAARVANIFAYEMVNYNLKLNIGMTAVDHLTIRIGEQQKRVQEISDEIADYRKQYGEVGKGEVNIPREQLVVLNQEKLDAKNDFEVVEKQWLLVQAYRRDHRDLRELSFVEERLALMPEQTISELIRHIYDQYAKARVEYDRVSDRLADEETKLIEASPIRVKYDSLQEELKVQQRFLVALEQRLELERALEEKRHPRVRVIQLATDSEEAQ